MRGELPDGQNALSIIARCATFPTLANDAQVKCDRNSYGLPSLRNALGTGLRHDANTICTQIARRRSTT